MYAASITSSLASPLSTPLAPLPPAQLAKTKAAAKQFEGVFISEMMSHMFEGTGSDPLFGGGQGEDMFHSLLVQEYGKQMAQGHGIGIADQLEKKMIQMQQQPKGI